MGSKPGEMALEALKRMNNRVSVFKVPPAPQGKRAKMKILTEEKYIEVSEIFTFSFVVFFSLLLLIMTKCLNASTNCNYLLSLGTGKVNPERFLSGLGKAEGTKRLFGCRGTK